jgi:L-rhamnose mutarotase
MKRVAFTMKLKKGSEKEYIKRHNNIWPELQVLLKKQDISDYSIFLDEETGTLFAVQKISGEEGSQDMGSNPIVRKWWDYMADIMEVNSDNSPRTKVLKEVFYLD